MKINNINLDIALTHVVTRKRQTLVAALGVTMGIAVFLFMNSLVSGFGSYSKNEMFKSAAHIKIYKEDEMSKPLVKPSSDDELTVIVNPQITTISKTLINPFGLLNELRKQPFVKTSLAQVNVDVFYNNGKSQLKGAANGVNIREADAMFDIAGYMIAGHLTNLQGDINAIIIGKGIADKLSLELDDNITVSSAEGVVKILKIKGIFSTGNTASDQSKSYINITTAQQLAKEGPSYVTTLYANVPNPDDAPAYASTLQQLTHYKVEPWQVTNADFLAGDVVRNIMMRSISLSILIVAAFGIYNILNMTVMQKINDIAILKATGFSSKDVIRIFVAEAVVMGVIGCLMGLAFGSILIWILSNIYMGGPIEYFPIGFEVSTFTFSFLLGITVTLAAGFFPALKASRVDPVEIFRK
jgi:lipoprotein-releasing system permease protein